MKVVSISETAVCLSDPGLFVQKWHTQDYMASNSKTTLNTLEILIYIRNGGGVVSLIILDYGDGRTPIAANVMSSMGE